MKNQMKKWIASLCLVAMMLSLLPAAAFADEDVGSSFTDVPVPAADTVVAETPTIDVNIVQVDIPSTPLVETYTAPVETYTAPVETYTAPVETYTAPVEIYTAPVETYTAPVETYTAPVETYTAPVETYTAPVETYTAPVETYTAPAETYTAPAETYTAPVETYTAPVETYTAPVETAPVTVELTTSSPAEAAQTKTESSSVEPEPVAQEVVMMRSSMGVSLKSSSPAVMTAAPDSDASDQNTQSADATVQDNRNVDSADQQDQTSEGAPENNDTQEDPQSSDEVSADNETQEAPAPVDLKEAYANLDRPGNSETVTVSAGVTSSEKPSEDEAAADIGSGDDVVDADILSANSADASDAVPQQSDDVISDDQADEPVSSDAEVSSGDTASRDQNWETFYNAETNTYQLTFTITEDAEGDQTIDLTHALYLLAGYSADAYKEYEGCEEALDEFLEYVKDDNSLSTTENALNYLREHGYNPEEDAYIREYAKYMVDSADYEFIKENYPGWLDYYFENGNPFPPALKTDQAQAIVMEPGDRRYFEIFIKSESGHTYKYKDGSFVLATPEIKDGDPEVEGFDGQGLSEDYKNDGYNRLGYKSYGSYLVNAMVDPLKNDPEATVEKLIDSPIAVLVYRAQIADAANQKPSNVAYYGGGNGTPKYLKTLQSETGLSDAETYALYALSANPNTTAVMKSNKQAVEEYMAENYGEGEDGFKAYLLDYYTERDGVAYADFDELTEKSTLVQDLKQTIMYDIASITLPEYTDYNNFYKNLLSFAYGDSQVAEADTTDSWNYKGNELTVGDYMTTRLTEEGAWDKANSFFNGLLEQGLTSEEASWTAFNMALNIDGELTGNDYQLTKWGYYNSIQLDQIDGDFSLEKVDDLGNTITDSETTFQLWYYQNSKESEQKDKYYYTLIKSTKEDGTVTETPGFVKYEEGSGLTYTIDTTRGKLDINNKMLEGIVYYLQEVAAPEGFALDATVYIICDNEDTAKEAEQLLKDITASESSDGEAAAAEIKTQYAGKIDSEKKCEVKITNTAIVDVSVNKTWDDDNNRDGIRPDDLVFDLYAGDTKIDSIRLSDKNSWQHVFENLPMYADREAIEYQVREQSKVKGYTTSSPSVKTIRNESGTRDLGYVFSFTNSHTPEKIEIHVSKTWDDGNDADGIRPDTIEVTLYANGEAVATVNVSKDADWAYTFKELMKNEAGKEILYTIGESAVRDYLSDISGKAEDGFVITNTHTPEPDPDPDPVPPTPPTPPVTPTPVIPAVPVTFVNVDEGGANPQPGLLEIDDFATPLAGGLNMNEGDCFN